jgi:hypothetical protein
VDATSAMIFCSKFKASRDERRRSSAKAVNNKVPSIEDRGSEDSLIATSGPGQSVTRRSRLGHFGHQRRDRHPVSHLPFAQHPTPRHRGRGCARRLPPNGLMAMVERHPDLAAKPYLLLREASPIASVSEVLSANVRGDLSNSR